MQLRFGSSGIRGAWGDPVTPEAALTLGRALSPLTEKAVVGRDHRTTSPLLARALSAGLASAGVSVIDCGPATSPTVAHAAREVGLGVQVTASHNPPTDNGFKVFGPDGAGLDAKDRERVERALQDPPGAVGWDQVRQIARTRQPVRDHGEAILDVVGPADLDVVLDGANGPGGPFTAELLSRQGCRVASIHASKQRRPARPSEPTPEHLADLAGLVRRREADLGLAHDGDADRLAAVDATGHVLTGDELLLVLVEHLDPDRVVVPVNATMALEDGHPGLEVVRCAVGDPAIAAELMRGGGFGGEPSNSWIFPDLSYCPDGPRAALELARIVGEAGPLGDLVPETYPMHRQSLPCPETAKPEVLDRFAAQAEGWGEIDRTDGLRIQLEDAWVLVRPSGTEPKVRLTVEARDDDRLDDLVDRATDALGGCLP